MRITQLAIARPVSATMATIALLLFGVLSVQRLPIHLLPDLSYPTLTIRTELPEAAPAEVEALLSKPIEDVVGVVNNVVRVSSISRAGQSDVMLAFAWDANIDLAALEVRERLDRLALPAEAEAPILLRYDPALDPIMRLSLSGAADLTALRSLADDSIKRELEVVEGVAAVDVSGGFEAEIQVDVDDERLARLGVSLPQVVERLRQENIDLAGGAIQDGDARYLVRTLNAFISVADIGDIVVGRRAAGGQASILLRDVAEVRRGHKDRRLITRINGREAIELAVYKRMDANTVRVSERVRQRIQRVGENLRRRQQPAHIQIISEQAGFIRQAIQEVLSTAAIGGLLAMLTLYVFLRDMRSTLIIGSAIPVSIIGSFFLMYLCGVSLNIMSLGGLALGIGMLVDNAIVVLESIDRQRALGLSRAQAALRGALEVGQAITASTLTTICVFAPLVFVQGVAGQLFNNLALTVSFSLLLSLAVAVTLIPMLAAVAGDLPVADEDDAPEHLVDSFEAQVRGFQLLFRLFGFLAFPFVWALGRLIGVFNRVFSRLTALYLTLLRAALRRRLLTGLGVLAACASMACLGPLLQYELLPELYQGELIADVTLATGAPLETTAAKVGRLEALAMQQPHVLRLYSSIGRRQQSGAALAEEREHIAQMRLILTPEARPADEAALLANLRQAFQDIAGVDAQFARPAYFSFELPLEVEIRGYDLDKLQSAAQQVVGRLSSLPGLTDIRSSMAPGEPELQITFDREKLATLNLDVAAVASLIKHHVQGEVATELKQPVRDVDIRVRARPTHVQGIDDVARLQVNPNSAIPTPLSAVARLTVARGPSEIRREDLRRVAVISANIQGGALGQTVREAQQALSTLSLPAGLTAAVRGQSAEMVTAFQSLAFALALATFLVYLVLASQFESFTQPCMILFAIPLGFGGVILALWLTGQAVNVMVAIGAVLLVGIVVNNAIVLIDYANQRRQHDAHITALAAAQEAAAVRFRPIVMTTATTVLGLLPMALGLGNGAELRAPLAITVIGGLVVGALLTLFVMPLAYSLVGGGRRRGRHDDLGAEARDAFIIPATPPPSAAPQEPEPPPDIRAFALPPPADDAATARRPGSRHGVMLPYLAKRLALAIPALFLVTVMVFALVRLIPGDVVEMMYEEQGYAEDLDEMRELLGLHQPWRLQYAAWLRQVLRGDLGVSLWTENDVVTELASRLPVTLELSVMAIAFAVVLAIPLGVVAAAYPDTAIDHITRSIAIGGLAVPGFWIATMVITLPAYYFGWTPPIQYVRFADNPLGHLGQFVIPAVILGMASSATVMRLTRAMMLEVLRQDYVRTAWAKGLHDELVILKHALRNALIPVMTILGIQLAQIAGGAVIIESIFNLPGIGKFLLDAITQRDYPVVQGINLCLAVLVIGLNLAVDLAYALIDPRVRYE